jgi:hypothetical protein
MRRMPLTEDARHFSFGLEIHFVRFDDDRLLHHKSTEMQFALRGVREGRIVSDRAEAGYTSICR